MRGMGTTTLKAKLLQQIISIRETILHIILLDLRKSYYELDRDRCLDILTGYGVRPRMLHILRTSWFRLKMEAKAGGHYRPDFQIYHRVTQGYPLSPTIFNMVVDAVIQHWMTVLGYPVEGAGQEALGTPIQDL